MTDTIVLLHRRRISQSRSRKESITDVTSYVVSWFDHTLNTFLICQKQTKMLSLYFACL